MKSRYLDTADLLGLLLAEDIPILDPEEGKVCPSPKAWDESVRIWRKELLTNPVFLAEYLPDLIVRVLEGDNKDAIEIIARAITGVFGDIARLQKMVSDNPSYITTMSRCLVNDAGRVGAELVTLIHKEATDYIQDNQYDWVWDVANYYHDMNKDHFNEPA